ncbi:MAG: hypothetical protein JWM09_80 [Francisellaceae bacterium]|nr:hypothetical protein [Francisellaceae bacterium]
MRNIVVFYLNILYSFLNLEYIRDENELLGSVLSDMSIYTWKERKPGNAAVWFDWKKLIKERMENLKLANQNYSFLKFNFQNKDMERSFMAVFHMLDQYYWENSNDITLKEVVNDIKKCLSDIEQGKENSVLNILAGYLKAEENNEYNFD